MTPRLLNQTRGLDFGAGFYLTSSKNQAARFSHNVVRRSGEGEPTVSIYEFDFESAQDSLDICQFESADGNWLSYIKENRLKQYSSKACDIVIGAVANDDVLPTIILYMNGQIDENLAIGALKTRKLVDQYCFKSDKAIALLRFTGKEVYTK
jgi:hypothetical protein